MTNPADLQWKHAALTVKGRTFVLRARVKDQEGRPLCRWCGELVVSPRRSWCSKACVKEYEDATRLMSSTGQRDHLLKLERGVCRSCGLDVEKLQKRMRRAYRLAMYFERVRLQDNVALRHLSTRQRAAAMIGQLVQRRIGRTAGKLDIWRSWWEADHIVPLIEGGDHSADNLRTLCIWCHRGETANLATRRAAARSAAP